jgi:TonB family protein
VRELYDTGEGAFEVDHLFNIFVPMKKIFFLCLFMIASLAVCVAQDDTTDPVDSSPPPEVAPAPTDEVFTVVEESPVFPGGEDSLRKFIAATLRYPKEYMDAGIQGIVYVQFVVNKEGKVTDVKLARGIKGAPGMDKEAMRVVSSMPHWKPGKQNGRVVSVRYIVPVKFRLADPQPKKNEK